MLFVMNAYVCEIKTKIIHQLIKIKNLKNEYDQFVRYSSFFGGKEREGHHRNKEIDGSCF